MDFLAVISVALLSSFSHCYAMCGGFNIAFLRLNSASNDENVGVNSNENSQNTENSSLNSKHNLQNSTNLNKNSANSALNSARNSQNNENSTISKLNPTNSTPSTKKTSIKFTLSLVYHIFRVLAYMLLGVIFGAFGNVLSFLNKGIFFFVLGIFMVLLGLALNFRGQFLAFFENPFFFNLFAKKMWQRLNFKGYKSAVVLGFCNGFVPCGLVYFYLALAMSQDSLIQSAFIMLVFGVCTLPALLFFNEIFSLLQRAFGAKFQNLWTKIAYFIIILYGIYLAYLGVSLTR